MPRYWATKSMISGASQPFSSCATASAAITADCFWSAGYLAISRSIFVSASSLSMSAASTVDFAEYDVLRPDDGDHVGDHVPARHFVQRREVRKTGSANLDPVRLVGAIGHDVD